MSNTQAAITEADVLDKLLTVEGSGFSLESTRVILSLRFSMVAIRRINELAAMNQQETWSDAERADLEKYLRVGNFLNVVQSKARACLSVDGGDTGAMLLRQPY